MISSHEDQYDKIAKKVMGRHGNNSFSTTEDTTMRQRSYSYGYDEYLVEVLDFEFLSVDTMYFEEKTSRFGNTGFYNKGFSYKEPKRSIV